jgi:hypothetical protein
VHAARKVDAVQDRPNGVIILEQYNDFARHSVLGTITNVDQVLAFRLPVVDITLSKAEAGMADATERITTLQGRCLAITDS